MFEEGCIWPQEQSLHFSFAPTLTKPMPCASACSVVLVVLLLLFSLLTCTDGVCFVRLLIDSIVVSGCFGGSHLNCLVFTYVWSLTFEERRNYHKTLCLYIKSTSCQNRRCPSPREDGPLLFATTLGTLVAIFYLFFNRCCCVSWSSRARGVHAFMLVWPGERFFCSNSSL